MKPRNCSCCGAVDVPIEGNSLGTRELRCECDHWRICELCFYCSRHCRCTRVMKNELAAAEVKFARARHKIRRKFWENVNQKIFEKPSVKNKN